MLCFCESKYKKREDYITYAKYKHSRKCRERYRESKERVLEIVKNFTMHWFLVMILKIAQ